MSDQPDPGGTLVEEELAVLVDLVVRGMRSDQDPALERLVALGLAVVRGPYVVPSAKGSEKAAASLQIPEGPAHHDVLMSLDAFLPLNRRLRRLCSAWQVRPDGSPNDHLDPDYEDDIFEQLEAVDAAVAPVLRRLSEVVGRFGSYRPRLRRSLERFEEGDGAWLASPMIDSYHTVWMQLHHELLLTLGMSRAEDEAREERLVQGGGR